MAKQQRVEFRFDERSLENIDTLRAQGRLSNRFYACAALLRGTTELSEEKRLTTVEDAERRGFTQGIAWAISLLDRYPVGPGGLLKESGLSYAAFKGAGVVASDLKQLRRVFRNEGMPVSRHRRDGVNNRE